MEDRFVKTSVYQRELGENGLKETETEVKGPKDKELDELRKLPEFRTDSHFRSLYEQVEPNKRPAEGDEEERAPRDSDFAPAARTEEEAEFLDAIENQRRADHDHILRDEEAQLTAFRHARDQWEISAKGSSEVSSTSDISGGQDKQTTVFTSLISPTSLPLLTSPSTALIRPKITVRKKRTSASISHNESPSLNTTSLNATSLNTTSLNTSSAARGSRTSRESCDAVNRDDGDACQVIEDGRESGVNLVNAVNVGREAKEGNVASATSGLVSELTDPGVVKTRRVARAEDTSISPIKLNSAKEAEVKGVNDVKRVSGGLVGYGDDDDSS
eukprot:GHVN01029203.1.p1 GENE.GHVN01029203.1~~GHVN01029203.1.p1  ORF type:complete len:330 (+),score=112.16 GHVN01029203.1:40-1029(+)